MPAGLKRYQYSGDQHFVTFSCYERRPYLGSAQSRDAFISVLERAIEQYRLTVVGFVIMPEHVHLLTSELAQGALASAVRSMKQSMAQSAVTRPFWCPRYYDFNVFSAAKGHEKLAYMHMNPVKRGLSRRPEDWQWSSAARVLKPPTHLIGYAAEDGAPSVRD